MVNRGMERKEESARPLRSSTLRIHCLETDKERLRCSWSTSIPDNRDSSPSAIKLRDFLSLSLFLPLENNQSPSPLSTVISKFPDVPPPPPRAFTYLPKIFAKFHRYRENSKSKQRAILLIPSSYVPSQSLYPFANFFPFIYIYI